ncbi:MAG: M20/M25/M40 family metallo-hydrolase [Planctomycetes bacterium]|nr:M20/M25/M40 family metallo-hydrolase [Planctomycetota bacterium]
MAPPAVRVPRRGPLPLLLAFALGCALVAGCTAGRAGARPGRGVEPRPSGDEPTSARIVQAALASNGAYDKLVSLCDDVGNRLSGSPALERAVEWAVHALEADGQENVRREPVRVPKWVRGRESLALVEPEKRPLAMLGLGGSVGTPPEGVTAELVVVHDRRELDALGERATGKIVLFNRAMPPFDEAKGTRYGETVEYRVNGAVWAAERGAVAALVRSVTARSLGSPHTGMMKYGDAPKRIPTAAVSVEDAERLDRLTRRGKHVVVRLSMEAHDEGEAPSANVVAELIGREKPEEVVLVSGHLDSWDVGQGAQDDGSGCVIAMESLALLRRLGLRPRRTIRVVLWTNEENGMAGVKGYLAAHAGELARHVAVIEADSGAFAPRGFHLDHRDPDALKRATATLKDAISPLAVLGAAAVFPGGSAPDVGHFKEAGVPCLGLAVDESTYFDYHHSAADTVDKVEPSKLARCVATMAGAAYALAEMPSALVPPSR